MPLKLGVAEPTLTDSLAGAYGNFASMMSARAPKLNDAASASLNNQKSIATEFQNKINQDAYASEMATMPQQGTMIEGNMAVDRPFTPEQLNQRSDIRNRAGFMGMGDYNNAPFSTNAQGLTTSNVTGDNPYLGQGEQTEMNQQTLAMNAAKIAKDQADAVANDPSKWDDSYTTTWRGEWKKEHIKKAYDVMNEAQRSMESFYESSGETDSNIPDYSLIVKYAKLLDPDSVVRSSEVDAIINETGVGGIINSIASKVKGGGRLTAEERDAFMSASRKLTSAVRKAAIAKQTVYQDKARAGGRFSDVVIDPIKEVGYDPLRTSPEYKTQQAAATKAEAKIAYKEAYDAIKAQYPGWTNAQVIAETNRRTGGL